MEQDLFNEENQFDMSKIVPDEIIEPPDDSSEEEPDVEDIQDKQITANNHTTCINDELTALKEVFDEDLCASLVIGFYDACSKYSSNMKLLFLGYLFFRPI